MSNSERGLYISLLCIQWSRGAVSQADIDRIATPSFPDDVAIVVGKFRVGKDGLFRNKRMEIERKKQVEYRESCSNSGKAGAYKRWGRHSHPTVSPLAKNSSPSPSPISTSTEGVANNGETYYEQTQALKALLNLLFKRNGNGHWSNPEERALCDVAKRPDFRDEFKLIVAYRESLPEKDYKFFPQTVVTLLEKWGPTLDRAKNVKERTVW